jgi:hypothetical protein
VLQDLVEKVMILRKAVELSRGQAQDISSGFLADKLSQYAGILAAQGSLNTAINYLGESNEVIVTNRFILDFANLGIRRKLFLFFQKC